MCYCGLIAIILSNETVRITYKIHLVPHREHSVLPSESGISKYFIGKECSFNHHLVYNYFYRNNAEYLVVNLVEKTLAIKLQNLFSELMSSRCNISFTLHMIYSNKIN